MSHRNLLIGILAVSALLRLFTLSTGDPINDESSIAFRSIGLMDFDLAEFQTTPLEWFDPNIPAWTALSFHDHPPLMFYLEHIGMGIFGENRFGFRIFSALAGIVSVYVLYAIGKRLYSKNVGLIAAALLGFGLNAVHYSRVGMQESVSILFILLTILFAIRGKDSNRNYLFAGIAFGFALLTKYTCLFLIPALGLYIFMRDREAFRKKMLWFGILCALVIFSPVIIYNIQLFNVRGHFDFQFSYIFHQNPAEWQVQPGKETGSFTDRIGNFVPRLVKSNSWLFLTFAGLGIMQILSELISKSKETWKRHELLIYLILCSSIFILFFGPAYRFLALLFPFLVLVAAYSLYTTIQKIRMKTLAVAFLVIICGFEIFYTSNNELLAYARGPHIWFASPLRVENERHGYSELDNSISEKLQGKYPGVVFVKKYDFLEKLQNNAIEKAKKDGLKPSATLFVYDQEIFNLAELWIMSRQFMYHGWPFIPAEQYYALLSEQGTDIFKKSGFTEMYAIIPGEALTLRRVTPFISKGKELKSDMMLLGAAAENVMNPRGETAFTIYKLSL